MINGELGVAICSIIERGELLVCIRLLLGVCKFLPVLHFRSTKDRASGGVWYSTAEGCFLIGTECYLFIFLILQCYFNSTHPFSNWYASIRDKFAV